MCGTWPGNFGSGWEVVSATNRCWRKVKNPAVLATIVPTLVRQFVLPEVETGFNRAHRNNSWISACFDGTEVRTKDSIIK